MERGGGAGGGVSLQHLKMQHHLLYALNLWAVPSRIVFLLGNGTTHQLSVLNRHIYMRLPCQAPAEGVKIGSKTAQKGAIGRSISPRWRRSMKSAQDGASLARDEGGEG